MGTPRNAPVQDTSDQLKYFHKILHHGKKKALDKFS